ncbi:hypothetical protein [Nocardia sp. NBC_00403]|uniref:hypothetical protein n=1 Tax=Nocardia sp. NBC_00403 TaxID=2975990 RepID=UPI002E1BAB0E
MDNFFGGWNRLAGRCVKHGMNNNPNQPDSIPKSLGPSPAGGAASDPGTDLDLQAVVDQLCWQAVADQLWRAWGQKISRRQ